MEVEEHRARFLVELIGRYARKDSRILEVGCRAGRNLVSLWRAGFTELSGIESRAEKVGRFREEHPGTAARVHLAEGRIDELLRGFDDEAFDLVFTVGFLFDREGDYAWLFPELARLTGSYLVSIEHEGSGSLSDEYGRLGLVEVESIDASRVEGIESVFFARVFEKRR